MLTTNIDTAQVIRELNSLSIDLKEQALKAGVAEVAKGGLLQLKSTVPVGDTGNVKQSLGRKTLKPNAIAGMGLDADAVAMLVGPNRKVKGFFRSRIANILEGGAKKHPIYPHGAVGVEQFQRITRKKGFEYAQGMRKLNTRLYIPKWHKWYEMVNHPGMGATRFIAQADSALSGQAEALFYKGLSGFLDRHR